MTTLKFVDLGGIRDKDDIATQWHNGALLNETLIPANPLFLLSLCIPVMGWFDEVGNDKYDSCTFLECSGVDGAIANGITDPIPECFIDETEGKDAGWEICLLGRFWPVYLICSLWLLVLLLCWKRSWKDAIRREEKRAAELLLSVEDDDDKL